MYFNGTLMDLDRPHLVAGNCKALKITGCTLFAKEIANPGQSSLEGAHVRRGEFSGKRHHCVLEIARFVLIGALHVVYDIFACFLSTL